MSIATYSDMVTAVGDWLDRSDLAARVPDFLRLTESRLNRLLDDPDMEVTETFPATGEFTPLPLDFGEMVSISVGEGPLASVGPVEFAGYDRTISGDPRVYSIVNRAIAFAPANATVSITLVYRRSIPALTSINTTNWLLTRAPDVYLYGALVQASAFLAEDDRVGLWKSAFDEAVSELRMDSQRRKWGAGPIAPRIRRT